MSSCANTQETKTTSCDGFKLIYISKHDVLTLETKEQILAHNIFFELNCEANHKQEHKDLLELNK